MTMADEINTKAPSITDADLSYLMDMLTAAMGFANDKRIPMGYFVATKDDASRKPTLDESFSNEDIEFMTGEVGPLALCIDGFTQGCRNVMLMDNVYAGETTHRKDL